jgi:hypothetical protein
VSISTEVSIEIEVTVDIEVSISSESLSLTGTCFQPRRFLPNSLSCVKIGEM